MIQIYKKGNTKFDYNGDCILFPESCLLKAVLKADWELTVEVPVDEDGRWKYVEEEAVICVDTFVGKKQLFPIYQVEKTNDTISARAYPIFFNSRHDAFLVDVRPTNKKGQEALDIMTKDTKYKAVSDITNVSTSYYINNSLLQAINGEDENSFTNRWCCML